MLARAAAVLLSAGALSGCAIDRVEWESAGFPVEEVTRDLEEKHHAHDPKVECIKREVGGAVWECRATSAEATYGCEVKVGPREAIRSVECEPEVEAEPEHADDAGSEEGSPPG
jgi:hypothetical protein